jgi:hypothetical protein
MVWARTKLLIWDYIFEPVKEIKISYTGKGTEKFYNKLNELIRTVFNVPEGYIQEKSYKWEKVKGSEHFAIEWEVNKILDKFSYIVVEIALKGYSTKGEGKVSIKLKPRLITEYPQDTPWQQSIIYEMFRRMWHVLFYHKQRMQYLDYGKELLTTFEGAIKSYCDSIKQ